MMSQPHTASVHSSRFARNSEVQCRAAPHRTSVAGSAHLLGCIRGSGGRGALQRLLQQGSQGEVLLQSTDRGGQHPPPLLLVIRREGLRDGM